jgi:NitT/TauT family transport system substrate-binding protein
MRPDAYSNKRGSGGYAPSGVPCFRRGGQSPWPCLLLLSRRALTAGLLASVAARPAAVVRLGILPFGSVQWVADVIAYHHLDASHGFRLQTAQLANTEAAKVALLGGAVDVAFSDWPFVASERAHGGQLCFAAGGSSSSGGIMVAAGSPVRALADLKGLRLGIAGGAADKSWLLVRAAALRAGVDLARQATLSYGAPPLLEAMQVHGDLDALLTFWNFAARLEAAGFREAISVAECARALGVAGPLVLVGYVFDAPWATANRAAIDGFLGAAAAAVDLLATSAAEWDRIRPLMNAPAEPLFQALRRRFVDGISHPGVAALTAQAAQIEALLAPAGSSALPAGVFWPR